MNKLDITVVGVIGIMTLLAVIAPLTLAVSQQNAFAGNMTTQGTNMTDTNQTGSISSLQHIPALDLGSGEGQ